ncbi:hypothetical protein GHT06_007746 [Daphnia sinensis]|uniref:Uncharacterized protein n=1 Tax=Daphnia sinensis TaxID=1820382 RepID=A0AAD5LKI1_9CRUS|nr:hypothetical protein GHT06_007746 [Daphnia sinensis]
MGLTQSLTIVIKLRQPRLSSPNTVRNKLSSVLFEALSLVGAKSDEACPTSDRSRSIWQFGFVS